MNNTRQNVVGFSLFTDFDIHLFKEGRHFSLWEKMGSHLVEIDGVSGTYFAVWAPNAKSVSVIGDFNDWNPNAHALFARWDSSGIWEGFIPHVKKGDIYKYQVDTGGLKLDKGDPFAFRWEVPPCTASVVWDLNFQWKENNWSKIRAKKNSLDAPISIYELHFGSWKRDELNRSLTYKKMAEELPVHLKEMGFTHVEFMPLMEHPFYGSWGYQKVGYFAPSSRYGTPQEFMELIEALHNHDIGVYLDWVPSHFPSDLHGLAYFDGTHLYEHEDYRKGFHPEWKSYIFNFGRHEVQSFLISSAAFWFEKYQIDGLRVDAVSSMLYLDYSRKDGEWAPNIHGGRENLEAMQFLRTLNTYIYEKYPYAQMIAEESTAWPQVSRPVSDGGLGFGMKWNMGWMHDTLNYFAQDPIYRKFHHNNLLFSMVYIYNENFILSISHDEIVYGKSSLLGKMPGDDWQKFANLRLLLGYMFMHPGKKLLFMGTEIASWDEWDHEHSLDWHLLQYDRHHQIYDIIRDLNHLYVQEHALHGHDFCKEGFEWIDMHDEENSVITFMRQCGKEKIVVVCNFTPVVRDQYKIGVPSGGFWKEIFNSDSSEYGGSNVGNMGGLHAEASPYHGQPCHLTITVPPLAVVCFKSMLMPITGLMSSNRKRLKQ
jgi:1,4-alpha-glucan branching enzyme